MHELQPEFDLEILELAWRFCRLALLAGRLPASREMGNVAFCCATPDLRLPRTRSKAPNSFTASGEERAQVCDGI